MVQNTIFAKAFKAAWVVYSIAALLIIIISACIQQKYVLQATPACYSIRQFGKPCFMCGSTRSFMQMGRGNIHQALSYNRFAVALFLIFIVNSIIFTYYTTNFLKQKITT